VAAPVIDASGRGIVVLSIIAPEQRMITQNRKSLISSVTNAAKKLSQRLG